MSYINIVGKLHDFDRVVREHVIKHDIHLEYAVSELKNIKKLMPFIEANPYAELLRAAGASFEPEPPAGDKGFAEGEAVAILSEAAKKVQECKAQIEGLVSEKARASELMELVAPFLGLDCSFETLFKMEFIRIRFGRLPLDSYKRLDARLNGNTDVIFIPLKKDSGYVWGVYFAPKDQASKVDGIFSVLHFERIKMPAEFSGLPAEVHGGLERQLEKIDGEISAAREKIKEYMDEKSADAKRAYAHVKYLSVCFDVRKFAAYAKDNFYIVGWMPEKQAKALIEKLEADPVVTYVLEDEREVLTGPPPTKLKNLSFFKPFELYVKMYGLPAYNEIDPTAFLALTYAFLFGMMFGDVGQGAVLAIGGALLYKFKRIDLAAVGGLAGVFSVLFGFLYGSFFGNEELLPSIWLKPTHSVINILIAAVAIGILLIFAAMALNIINAIKARDFARAFFSPSGAAGFLFYGSIILAIALPLLGLPGIGGGLLAVLVILSLLVMALKEPLSNLIKGEGKVFPEKPGMFILESFFELFEILLSYVTNTVSFVRVGAFALSHAGMMLVVSILMKMSGAVGGAAIFVIGNIVVVLLEGLIVGIQVLRLEYYEMFSRFFSGTGHAFIAYGKNADKF